MKMQTSRFRPNLIFWFRILLACTLAATFAACSEKPPSENDAKTAVQYYLLGKFGNSDGPGFSEGQGIADTACGRFNSPKPCGSGDERGEWAGTVKEVARVIEIGPSKADTKLITKTNRFGVSSWDTEEITVWPVKVQLTLECSCVNRNGRIPEVPLRTATANAEYKVYYIAELKDHWWVHR